MRAMAKVLLLFVFSGLAAAAESPAWVGESNEHAKVLLEVMARFSPESATQIGVEGYDDQVTDLKPKVFQRSQDATRGALKELKARLGKATDPSVKQDLEIMIRAAQDNIDTSQLQNELLLPYAPVSRIAFSGNRALLDPRVS